ncbi:hypothetical protein F5B18DRAFT_633800 [Nemania serpens]|nr:hypothetical protein F5B18DRAFT_633800 [Nemania serpens]
MHALPSDLFLQVPDAFSQVSGDLSRAPDLAVPQNEDRVFQTKHDRNEPVTPFTCVKCSKEFRNDSELSKHGKDMNDELSKQGKGRTHNPYACHCGERFSRLDSITRHCSRGQPGAKHPCPVCTKHDGYKAFTRIDHLMQHLRGTHKFDDKGIAWLRVRGTRRSAGPPAGSPSNA